MSERRRRCEFCRRRFVPDPRVGDRQRACHRKRCRKKRRKKSQSEWLARHPDAFRGRYPKLRSWLEANPGYLRNYRATHPKHRARRRKAEHQRRIRKGKARVDIQDTIELQTRLSPALQPKAGRVDIQDERPLPLLLFLGLFLRVASSMGRVDMQDSIEHPIATAYARGLEVWQWATQQQRAGRARFCKRSAVGASPSVASPGSIGASCGRDTSPG